MSDKKFSDLFSKLSPTGPVAELLAAAGEYSTRRGESAGAQYYEFTVSFDRVFPKSELYALEQAICDAYGIFSVRIFPRYPAELFTVDYVDEVITESRRVGIISNGFFS